LLEYLAYAVLLIGLTFVVPLWIGLKTYLSMKRSQNHVFVSFLRATAITALSIFVCGYAGFISAIFLGCHLHPMDSECEYVAQDTVFGK